MCPVYETGLGNERHSDPFRDNTGDLRTCSILKSAICISAYALPVANTAYLPPCRSRQRILTLSLLWNPSGVRPNLNLDDIILRKQYFSLSSVLVPIFSLSVNSLDFRRPPPHGPQTLPVSGPGNTSLSMPPFYYENGKGESPSASPLSSSPPLGLTATLLFLHLQRIGESWRLPGV